LKAPWYIMSGLDWIEVFGIWCHSGIWRVVTRVFDSGVMAIVSDLVIFICLCMDKALEELRWFIDINWL
jgi:hypothetical protein